MRKMTMMSRILFVRSHQDHHEDDDDDEDDEDDEDVDKD